MTLPREGNLLIGVHSHTRLAACWDTRMAVQPSSYSTTFCFNALETASVAECT